MRICRLDLLRYGHLTDVVLDFPADALLHVVVGANESGKSTALAAIGDALFGFGHHSDYDFLHGGPNLRIGLAVKAADGTTAHYFRRKGRKDTLLDEFGAPTSEAALQRLIGGSTRELFEQFFGLNGARLREGGSELIRSGGDAGESLLAGSGLLNVRKVIERLDEEAKTLVGDGRGRRRLAEAVEKWREAQRKADECAVLPRDWEAANRDKAEASTALSKVQEQSRGLNAENNRLNRVRRIAPILPQLDDARARLGAHANTPRLQHGSKERMAALIREREVGTRDLEREAAEIERLSGELEAIPADTAVLAAQDAIDALAERRPSIIQAQSDLLSVGASAIEKRAKILAAIEDLGVALSVEAALQILPGPGARRTVQRLINENAARIGALKTSLKNRDVARCKHDDAAERLQAVTPPASPKTLRQAIEDSKSEGRIEIELTKAERDRAPAERDVTTALAALPLWCGDLVSLLAASLPLAGDEAEGAQRLADTAKNLADAREHAGQMRDKLSTIEANIARLARGETVPTPDAVAGARTLRDRAWRLIRRLIEGGTEAATEELAGLPAGKLTDGFEMLRDDADRLADRRADDAQRVADYLGFTAQLQLVRERLAKETETILVCEAAAEAARREWLKLWERCGFVPGTPEAMQQWRRDREEVVRRSVAADDAVRRCEDLGSRRDHARKLLAELVAPTAAGETLASLLHRAERQCEQAEQAEADYQQLAQSLTREQLGLKESEQAVTSAEADLGTWQHTWAPAVKILGLPDDATVDTAGAALEAWGRIAELAPAWKSDEERIAQMRGAIDSFATDVATLRETLGGTSDDPPPAIVAHLSRRLAEGRDAARSADDLRKRIKELQAAHDKAKRTTADAERQLAEMQRLAGVGSDAELEQAIERALSWAAVADEAARLERQLLEQGDGYDEATLRTEVAATEIDLAAARIEEIDRELQDLAQRRDGLTEERIRAEDRIADMQRGRDAAAHAQHAADALADAQAAAERYARLHCARVLLRAGVERFRAEQQDPMLRHAGAHFSLLTEGRYVRLTVDQDAAGRMVLRAIRDEGTECPVEALSDGTRDQLYLALRIAAIEVQADRGELLPFIADDLLVNFDDRRAASAIRLLLRLGKSMQVMLFTHHEHIASLAAEQKDVAILRLPLPVAAIGERAVE